MKKIIHPGRDEKVTMLAGDIVYSQRREWCQMTMRPLKLSLMAPRTHYAYDVIEKLPCIVWLCGGGFTNVDRNVWTPELAYFAKNGYAVASVEYSTTPRTRFPMQLEDVKAAIRYLRANADFYHIDADNIGVMGESAGGYLSCLVSCTGNAREYDVGEYLDQSSAVKCACAWYGSGARNGKPTQDHIKAITPPDIHLFPDCRALIDGNTPATLLIHGSADRTIPLENSEAYYEALREKGIESDLYILEGADHADVPVVQPQVKKIILDFFDRHLK